MNKDLQIAELLTARVCHALAATVGAIGNGVELVEEFDASMRDEAMALVSLSATHAADQLKFFRMAYGSAGHEGLGNLSDVRALGEAIVDQEKYQVDWSGVEGAYDVRLTPGLGKMLLLMLELASEALVREGVIRISGKTDGPFEISATGPGAGIEQNLRKVLEVGSDSEMLSARTVHGWYALQAASALGKELSWRQTIDCVTYACG